MKPRDPIDCENCGTPFVPKSNVNRFCSTDCQLEDARLSNLGKRALVNKPVMTFAEIGKVMGLSHTGAENLFYSGMEKLRARINREDFR